MKLTLLGTGTPISNLQRYGPSQVVEVGDRLVLLDAGIGVVHRLLAAGYPRPRIATVALTHLHFDHIAGLHDLLWAGWIQSWWEEPPPIVGPPGTREFIAGLMQAFSYDIKVRTMGERRREGLVPGRIEEIEEGWSSEDADWRLSAFRVEHEPVDQAFGFRLDTADRSLVVSGDTKKSENLVRHAQGADLLVHEVYSRRGAETLMAATADPLVRARLEVIASYHTPADDVGQVAAESGAGHLVLTHLLMQGGSTPETLAEEIAPVYSGRLTVGADLQTFDLGRG
jgi:ribonuclease Z